MTDKHTLLRNFAKSVVLDLRHAGFDALWAGGCVRDQLLGMEPKDYDVATSATPDEVIRLFGRKRTVAVGAAFGVVIVLGPDKSAGQVEVATFRSDGEYRDGRRPVSVTYCRPEEDARRRDFSINGMFFDPISEQVIDYVGGQRDLQSRVIRAIGDPLARFREDKLRLLRAVRFAATLGYRLEDRTACAVTALAGELRQVSVERIAQELRRMLEHPTRAESVRALSETGLLRQIFPGFSGEPFESGNIQPLMKCLRELSGSEFETSLAAILLHAIQGKSGTGSVSLPNMAEVACRRLKLSNDETGCVGWLLRQLPLIRGIAARPLHVLKPMLADARSGRLLDLTQALAVSQGNPPLDAEFCRRYLAETPREQLDPPLLVNGHDVLALGVTGPQVRELLQQLRREQLDESLDHREQAITRLRQLVAGPTENTAL